MGLFGTSSGGLEADIENATSEKNVNENWGLIMDICDKIGSSSAAAKESLRMIVKRLNNPDPHVVVKAITLLDACIKNCGKNYHLEIASREFETEFKRLLAKSQPQIVNKLKQCLKRWAEGDFKKDPQLSLIPLLYQKMKQEGVDFTDQESTPKREPVYSKDPNVVSSQQEEDDIARAIELSLKEKTTSPKATSQSSNFSSLYPSVNATSTPTAAAASSSVTAPAAAAPEPRKVRALYDFEAAEDNELTFKAGEMIIVTEESDPNWWRGSNHRGEGFFPANFVSADLTAEPEEARYVESKTNIKKEKVDDVHSLQTQQAVEINEEAIDRLLFLLHEADPKDPSQDTDEMLRLENMVNQMGPLIDSELERVDRKHAQLTQLSSDLIETINMYHSLMRETDRAPPMMNMYAPPGAYPMYNNQAPYQGNYQRMPPASMIAPPGMGQGMPGQHLPPMNNYPMPSGAQNNFHPAAGFLSSHNPLQQVPGQFPPQPMLGQMPPQNQMMPQMHPQQQQQQQQQQQIPPQQAPGNDMNQNQQPPQQQNQAMMNPQAQGMMQQPPMMNSQQVPISQPSQHPQHFQNPQQPQIQAPIPTYPQQNGMNPQQQQQNYPMNPNMQLNHMMGNMSLQTPPSSMQNMPSMQQPGMNGMQITQPMTFNLQDSNQNVPVYQQR